MNRVRLLALSTAAWAVRCTVPQSCVVGVAGQHGNDAPVSVYDGASDSVKEGRQHDISWELGGLRTCLAI